MDNERITRSRPKRLRQSAVNTSPPTRRSSRPRSTVLGSTANKVKSSTPPTPIKEVREEVKQSQKSGSSLPLALTTNTSTRAPIKSQTTSSVHSSYSSTTQKTLEMRSSISVTEGDVAKLTNSLRRSLSKTIGDIPGNRDGTHTPITITDAESRYSRSVSRSVYEDDKYSKAGSTEQENIDEADDIEDDDHYQSFSTHNALLNRSSSTACRKIDAPREFGGCIGVTLLMLLIPCLVYYLQWCCGRSLCSFKMVTLPTNITSTYFTKKLFKVEAVSAYLALNFVVVVLSMLLFGKHVRLPTLERDPIEYKFNVLPIAIFVTIAAGVAEYLKCPVADFMLRHHMHFCIYGFVNAFIVAFWSYLRNDTLNGKSSSKINVYGRTGNLFIDYALGRQLNPKFMGIVEYKQIYYRTSLIITLIFAESFIYKNLQIPVLPVAKTDILNTMNFYMKNINYDPAALLSSSLLLFYILDSIIFEHHLANSFELQGEGFGCLLLLRYAATPYLISGVAKYFFVRRTPIVCLYAVIVPVALLLTGLTLKRLSNAIKYKFCIVPQNPFFKGMPTVHTYQGKRLLLGALWGCVRQPNYAGDIIAMIALSIPLFIRFAWPPLIGIMLCIIVLLHRAIRVNMRNLSRYHSSWMRYCNEVRYYIVPKIF